MGTLKARLAALEKADAAPAFDLEYFFACLFRSPGDAPPVRSTGPLISVAEYYQQLMERHNG
jgi:hypothetical protein